MGHLYKLFHVTRGVYDLIYDRGHYEDDDDSWAFVNRVPRESPFPNAYVVVQSCIDVR